MKNIVEIINKLITVKIDTKRVFGLDILRAIAIFSVLLGHSVLLLKKEIQECVLRLNPDGVSIFFVLSGFLIGGIFIRILEKEPISSKRLIEFWKRRWLRTIPPFVITLGIIVILNHKNLHLYILKYLFFIQNFFSATPPFFPESWSLSVEEWFYLLIPFFIFILCKLSIKPKLAIIFTIASVILACTVCRYLKFQQTNITDYDFFDENFRKVVIFRLDAIMYGFLGAYMIYYYKEETLKYKYFTFIFGLLLLLLYQLTLNRTIHTFNLYDVIFSISLTSLGTLFLLPLMTCIKLKEGFLYRVVTHLALISYSAYLLNFTVVINGLLDRFAIKNIFINYVFFWILTLIFSTLSYNFIEIPFMNLRKKIPSK